METNAVNNIYTRYSYSISDDKFVCIDLINGRGVEIVKDQVVLNDLDASSVINHLSHIQEVISARPIVDRVILLPKKASSLIIQELTNTDFEITYPNGSATYIDGLFCASKKFSMADIQHYMINAYDSIRLLQERSYGVGEYVTIDRINGIIIIDDKKGEFKAVSMLTPYQTNNVLFGCLINGKPYRFLEIFPDKLRNEIVFITNFNEEVGRIPYTSGALKALKQLPGFKEHNPLHISEVTM